MRVVGTDIYIAKGDTGHLSLVFREPIADTSFYMFIYKIGKIDGIKHTENNSVSFTFGPEITNNRIREYDYDLYAVFNSEENQEEVVTLIRKSKFTIQKTARSKEKFLTEDTDGEDINGEN